MLQISGFVSGLVVIVCFAKFLFKKPLIKAVNGDLEVCDSISRIGHIFGHMG